MALSTPNSAYPITGLAWLEGSWRGTGESEWSEETWTAPHAGAILGMFRLVVEGEVKFYEILTIRQEETGLFLRIRHFDATLRPWETNVEGAIVFRARTVNAEGATFESATDKARELVFARKGKDAYEVRLVWRDSSPPSTFTFKRVPPRGSAGK
jgi:hypothetical protein